MQQVTLCTQRLVLVRYAQLGNRMLYTYLWIQSSLSATSTQQIREVTVGGVLYDNKGAEFPVHACMRARWWAVIIHFSLYMLYKTLQPGTGRRLCHKDC